MRNILRNTLSITGKALGVGLIVADVALNVVGVILCVVTSQN